MHPKFKSITYFSVAFGFALAIIVMFGYYIDNKQKQKILNSLAQDQLEVLKLKISLFEDHVKPVISDFYYLSNLENLPYFNLRNQSTNELLHEFSLFTKANEYYQVEILDTLGMEKIRVNFKNNQTRTIKLSGLKDKSSSDYVQKSLKLRPNEIYISPLDLNKENDRIEIPLQHFLRIASPIYDSLGHKKGLIVINCNMNGLLWKLDTIGSFYQNKFTFGILNETGYWLNDAEQKPFDFLLDSLFSEQASVVYPIAWDFISGKKQGHVRTEEGFFIFKKFKLAQFLNELNFRNETGFTLPKDQEYIFLIHLTNALLKERLSSHPPILFGIIAIVIVAMLAIWAAIVKTQERKKDVQLKEMLLESDRQIKHLAIKNEQLESFVRIASHDLREPLATIKNMIMLMKEYSNKPIDDNFNDYANFIISCSERMDKLALSILEYAVNGKNSTLSLVNLNDLVQTILWDLKASIDASNTTVYTKNLPTLYAYELELKQLFQNIISNAIKYRKEDEDPAIRIDHKENAEYYTFTVSDNGIGIDEEDKQKAFLMFGRLQKKKNEHGLGMGLAICKKITDLHEGEIWFRKNEISGTTFVFTIKKNVPQESEDLNSKTVISGSMPILPG